MTAGYHHYHHMICQRATHTMSRTVITCYKQRSTVECHLCAVGGGARPPPLDLRVRPVHQRARPLPPRSRAGESAEDSDSSPAAYRSSDKRVSAAALTVTASAIGFACSHPFPSVNFSFTTYIIEPTRRAACSGSKKDNAPGDPMSTSAPALSSSVAGFVDATGGGGGGGGGGTMGAYENSSNFGT